MRKINLIVVHCSATRVDQPFPVDKLIACHQARFGFTGYHYYITRDGQLYQTRHENLPGAHARHYNRYSIGVCYEGGLLANGQPADTRTPEQRAALWHLLKSLKVDYPDAQILGHCELPEQREQSKFACSLPSRDGSRQSQLPHVAKTCPNFLASKKYATL